MAEGQVVVEVLPGEKDQKKGDAILFLKLPHELHLMGVDILQAEGRPSAFLGVKADGDPLDDTDIIHGAFLIKISECDMSCLAVDLHRRDRRGDLLDQRKPGLPVFLIGAVDQVLQQGTAQSSGLPGRHAASLSPAGLSKRLRPVNCYPFFRSLLL